jgi:hypothetical protein
MQTRSLDSYYELGDVYETIDTCDELEMQLGRLKRRRLLNEDEWEQSKTEVEAIRSQLESRVQEASLAPKGPRLP